MAPTGTILEKNGFELCELWTYKNERLKMYPLQVHRSFKRTWHWRRNWRKERFELVRQSPWDFTVPELSWSNCNSCFQPLFCDFSWAASSGSAAMGKSGLCWGGSVNAQSQQVKTGASFHPARAPHWLNVEQEELLERCCSHCGVYRGNQCWLFWFHSNHCNTQRSERDLVYFYPFSVFPLK